MGKDRFGLTLKQSMFVDAYLYGEKTKGNATASYRKAYDCDNMMDSSIHVEACKLLQSPKVSQRIEDKSREVEEKQQLRAVSLKQKVLDSLLLESQTASSDSARVQALAILGKTIPNFFAPEKAEVTQKMSVASAEKDLETAISKALADGKVVNLLNNKDSDSPSLGDSNLTLVQNDIKK